MNPKVHGLVDLSGRLLKRIARSIRSKWFELSYISGSLLLLSVSAVTAHLYDDTAFSQHAFLFYYAGVDPLYYSLQGLYYTGALIIAFAPVVWFQALGLSNVVIQQFFVKLPFTLCGILGGVPIYKILRPHLSERTTRILTLSWIFDPMLYFAAGIHGTPLVFAVVFLVLSLYWLSNGKLAFSAAALGVSTTTFVYPLLGLPMVAYSVWRGKGARHTALYLAIVIAVIGIGQLPSLILSVTNGLGTSQGLVISASNISIGGQQLPAAFSVFDSLNLFGAGYALTATDYLAIFLAGMLLPNLYFIAVEWGKSGPIDWRRLYVFFFIESTVLVLLDPLPGPQFLFAVSPFAVILTGLLRDHRMPPVFRIAVLTDFGLLMTGGSQNLFGFLANTNPSLLQYSQSFPPRLFDFLTLIYGIVLVFMIAQTWRAFEDQHPSAVAKEATEPVTHPSHWVRESTRHAVTSACLIIVATALVFALVAPNLGHPPQELLMLEQLDTWDAQTVSTVTNQTSGNLTAIYQLPGVFVLAPAATRLLMNATLNLSALGGVSPYVANWFAVNSTFQCNSTNYLAQAIRMDLPYSNSTFQIIVQGQIAPLVTLSLYTSLPPLPTHDVFSLRGSEAQSQPAPAGFYILTFDYHPVINSGTYYVVIAGATPNSTLSIGGSLNYPTGQNINPLFNSTGVMPRATLALTVLGSPVVTVEVNGNSRTENLNATSSEIGIPIDWLKPKTSVTLSSVAVVSSVAPVLKLQITYSRMIGSLSRNTAGLLGGSLAFAATSVVFAVGTKRVLRR